MLLHHRLELHHPAYITRDWRTQMNDGLPWKFWMFSYSVRIVRVPMYVPEKLLRLPLKNKLQTVIFSN